MRSMAGKLHPLLANYDRAELHDIGHSLVLLGAVSSLIHFGQGYLLLTASVSPRNPEQTYQVCVSTPICDSCPAFAVFHLQVSRMASGPYLPLRFSCSLPTGCGWTSFVPFLRVALCTLLGGLRPKQKIGLEVTQAIGRGIVRLEFLSVSAAKVYIYLPD